MSELSKPSKWWVEYTPDELLLHALEPLFRSPVELGRVRLATTAFTAISIQDFDSQHIQQCLDNLGQQPVIGRSHVASAAIHDEHGRAIELTFALSYPEQLDGARAALESMSHGGAYNDGSEVRLSIPAPVVSKEALFAASDDEFSRARRVRLMKRGKIAIDMADAIGDFESVIRHPGAWHNYLLRSPRLTSREWYEGDEQD